MQEVSEETPTIKVGICQRYYSFLAHCPIVHKLLPGTSIGMIAVLNTLCKLCKLCPCTS
jgi:hypothetical protein